MKPHNYFVCTLYITLVPSIQKVYKNQVLNYDWCILGDIFRPLNGHPQANLEQYC